MTPGDWFGGVAMVVAVAGLGMTFLRTARLQGGDRQRLTAVEQALKKHASSESVTSMGGRLDELEADVKHVVAAVAEVSIVKEKVVGLDRLMTMQLDEIKHTLRRLEERSFDPAVPVARSRRQPQG